MEENRNITELTDDQINELADRLAENRPAEAEVLKAIASEVNNTTEDNTEIEESVATATINHVTGKPELTLMSEDIDNPDYKIDCDATLETITNSSEDDLEKAVMTTAAESEMSDTSAMKLFELIMKLKKGEKITGVYNKLPKEMQDTVDDIMCKNPELYQAGRNAISKMLLDEFVNSVSMEKELVDFQTTMEKTLEIPDLLDMYADHVRDVMEVTTLESAQRLEEAGETTKAESLRKISAIFTESYKYDKLIEFLKGNRKARNRTEKDLGDLNKFIWDFNYKNKESKFAMNDIAELEPNMERILFMNTEDSEAKEEWHDLIKKFVILFVKQTESYNPDNVFDAAYMYYFIKNIIMVGNIDKIKTDFSLTIRANILKVFDAIEECEREYNVMMAERKKK